MGLVSYHQDVQFSLAAGHLENISAYSAWLYCLSLGSGSIFRVIVPLLVALPFADSLLRDKKIGYQNYILTRTSYRHFFLTRVLVNGLVGGFTVVLPMLIWLIISFVVYPANLPIKNLNYLLADPMAGIFYGGTPIFYILILILMGFVFGFLYASFSLGMSGFTTNRYVVIASSFLLYLILLLVSQAMQIRSLIPLLLITPYEAYPISSFNIIAQFLLILFITLSLLSGTYRQGREDLS